MSLKYRIAVVIFLLEAVMMAFVFSTTVSRSQAINKQQFTINENVILALLSDLSRFALFTLEYEDLQLYIEKITEDPHVIKLLIIERNNQIAVSSSVQDVGQEMPALVDTENEYWRTTTVTNSSGILGKVAIQFSNSELIKAKKEVLFVGLRVALIGMSIIAFVGILTGYILTRRLEVLSRAAQCVKDGNLEVETNLSGNDELALLGQVFDGMTKSFKSTIESLQAREHELRTAHHELERRVEERTSELAFANEELEHLATHDPLTGLPNRSLFLVKLHQSITKSQLEKTPFATVMMDLDRFKEVNDTLGHDVGDELLVQVGKRIVKVLRKTDTIARLGGDEFAIIFTDVKREEAINLCEKISQSLAEPFTIKNNDFTIGLSQGIAMFPEHATESSDLSKCADIAMYIAKRNQLTYVVYSVDDGQNVIPTLSLHDTLSQAIDNEELLLHYQPKLDIKTGEVVGVEALVRWQKNGNLVYPDDFIHYAEHTGLINPLTQWVLDNAIHQHIQWRSLGLNIKISINLSIKELKDGSLINYISELLEQNKVISDYVMLEIPELTIMSDPNRGMEVLQKIKNIGIGISIAEFGAGASSFVDLSKWPVDEIKIDRSLVVDMLSNNAYLAIVRSIIGLAHNLGINVTAEGVEHREIWDVLASLGCNVSQGYFTGRPMRADELLENTFSQSLLPTMVK